MAGQAALHVQVTRDPIDVTALQAQMGEAGAGAVLTFLGTVRDHKQGRRVLRIDYEAYEPMAEKELRRIGESMCERWPVLRASLVHRIGRLEVGEASVAIVVATAHRAPGFEALRYAIETLKTDVPIWKKEHFEDGAEWVREGA